MMASQLFRAALHVVAAAAAASTTPEQIRVTFHPNATQLVATWVSFETAPVGGLVQWGATETSLTFTANGTARAYVNDVCANTTRSVHTATFDAAPGAATYYRVSSDGIVWSPVLRVISPARTYPVRIALWGDAGVNCALPAAPQLARDAAAGAYDWAFHLGDTAYNMDDQCGAVGDAFLNAAQAYSAVRPLVYSNGNHEGGPLKQYSEYLNRLGAAQEPLANASGSPSSRYFAFEAGPVFVAAIDPDAWIYPLVYDLAAPQAAWLERILAGVNRTRTPWVILFTHRALYCTKTDDGECNSEAAALRDGWFGVYNALEPLLVRYGVDFVFSGHTHHYERTWPVKGMLATQANYSNPRAPVHIQTGIAGVDGFDPFQVAQAPWEAFRDTSYTPSYSLLTLWNATHASFEQRANANGAAFDGFELQQEQHGSFADE